MSIHNFTTVDEVITAMADYFVAIANQSITGKGRFAVALSGGGSPKKVFQLLASDAYKTKLDWTKIDCFFGDERYVPHTDDASNYKMANHVLLQPMRVPLENIFAVDTLLSPEDAAKDYWQKIKAYFKGAVPAFDLVMLGLGDNAHTASLFPSTPVLHEAIPGVSAVFLQDQQVWRITLNAPLINLASNVAFLVFGADKAQAVHQILKAEKNIELYPAQLIKPTTKEAVWFMDNPAASLIV